MHCMHSNLCMNATDYKVFIRVFNQTARVTERVHAYEHMIVVHVTRATDVYQTRVTRVYR